MESAFPELEELFLATNDGFSKMPLKSTVTAIKKIYWCLCSQRCLCTITDLYQEPKLKFLVPAFKTTSIRSILIMPLQYCQECVGCFTIFRNEIETETLWAGRCNYDERNAPLSPLKHGEKSKKGQAWLESG